MVKSFFSNSGAGPSSADVRGDHQPTLSTATSRGGELSDPTPALRQQLMMIPVASLAVLQSSHLLVHLLYLLMIPSLKRLLDRRPLLLKFPVWPPNGLSTSVKLTGTSPLRHTGGRNNSCRWRLIVLLTRMRSRVLICPMWPASVYQECSCLPLNTWSMLCGDCKNAIRKCNLVATRLELKISTCIALSARIKCGRDD